jgi:hypothetical protein
MSLSMRPRFRMSVHPPVDETMARIQQAIDTPDSVCYVDTYDKQFEIRIRKEHHHFWSPELNLIFIPGDSGTHMRGKFGPGAHLWTLFMAGYAVFGMIALGGALLAVSQLTIDESPTGWWIVLAGLIGCVFVYLAAQVGQRLAGPQIATIRKILHDTFPDHSEE